MDTSTNAGRFASEVTAAAASLERRLIAQRTREGMARIRATSGKHMGRPSTMAPEVEARIVELHDDGMSASAISRLFNDEGVDKGPEARSAMWNHSHIRAAVRRAEVRRAAQSCDVA